MWHKAYNQRALDHFKTHGTPLNEAKDYWEGLGNRNLIIPEVIINNRVQVGQEYFAVAGLFHLSGAENRGNHHLYFDAIDEQGNRLFGTQVIYNWDGMTQQQRDRTPPSLVEKSVNEPGGNIGIGGGQVINVVGIVEALSDSVRGVHTLGPDDEPGNYTAHHSTYLVLVRTIKRGEIEQPEEPEPSAPDPDPPQPDPDPTPPDNEDPPPAPEPEPVDNTLRIKAHITTKTMAMRVKKIETIQWLQALPEDEEGYVEFNLFARSHGEWGENN